MPTKAFVISITEANADGTGDASISSWVTNAEQAMGYRIALTEAHGEPMSGILSNKAMNELEQDPGVVLLDQGDQPSKEET